MTHATDPAESTDQRSVYRAYCLDVRIVETAGADGTRYRFEAPEHGGLTFEDPAMAELYADVFFDVNGFVEAGTGDRGVPPVIIQAGRDTLAAYLRTQPHADVQWVASFMGVRPEKVERYVNRVEKRGREIRRKLREHEAV